MSDNIKVNLISNPDNLLKIIYTACRTCYSDQMPIEIWDDRSLPEYPCDDCEGKFIKDACDSCSDIETYWEMNHDLERKMLPLVKSVIESGHYSTIEHISFTFTISGITRKTSHQLVRHRHMSFSQKSQRYVTYHKPFKYNTPDGIDPDKQYPVCWGLSFEDGKDIIAKLSYNQLMKVIQNMYAGMIADGVQAEDARDILPNACQTDMVVSLNLRELIHLTGLRLCTCAQKEIRIAVKKMVDLVVKEEPWLKNYLVPKCESIGFCTERKSCGRKPMKQDYDSLKQENTELKKTVLFNLETDCENCTNIGSCSDCSIGEEIKKLKKELNINE